ncbi:hypothetical protein HU200_016670 [Digitaria exilis]|uniref:Alpha/beta hydrolase fold-3 domain-containing protein n=1 Tax=Digitaria exilis TaxID=1010633 RepID=A0A835F7H8_9POAL|nr:hypothetical protein HU200_016666 [Digitaria exilis]KAF8730807.1 hypothetical protein HU200_016670 [Digitaria exilis]CAB3491265.1 unnamed protein product [Digitaria exilis]CAB3491267.1 unnamed protein product [Digitaria exilis]
MASSTTLSSSQPQPQPAQCPSSPTTEAKAEPPYVVEDCCGVLQILSDGTVVRFDPPPYPPGDAYDASRVEWKDVVYHPGHDLGVRIYRPRTDDDDDIVAGEEGTSKKRRLLPVLVFFHGGGFCFGSYSWPKIHLCCLRLAGELPAIVLSFDYRVAPEHRLPAAVDDAAAALLWLPGHMSSDPWLADDAPLSSRHVYVCGNSSGAGLVHHVLVRFGTCGNNLPGGQVKITGYILLMPPFLSEEPTQSELDTPETAVLSRKTSDKYFRLAFPVGADKDHPLSNPFGPGSPSMEPVDVSRLLVVAAECDLVRDKNVEYAQRLKAMGKDVELVMFAGQQHGFFVLKPLSPATDELIRVIRSFIAAE